MLREAVTSKDKIAVALDQFCLQSAYNDHLSTDANE